MTQIILSPRTLRGLRLLRLAAWTGVALCAGIQLLRPSVGIAENLTQHVIKSYAAAPTCGCAKHKGSIS